ncbi:MAG: translation initiation factor IF-2 [Gammaproteobacteria bacterium]
MAEITVEQFADVLKVTGERLIAQLAEAGITVDGPKAIITEDDKGKLLSHLRRSHGRDGEETAAPKKITLKRKQQTELRLSGSQGRSRTVSLEVRKKRTYVNRGVLEEEAKQAQDELDRERDGEREKREAQEQAVEEKRLEAERASRKREEEQERLRAEEQARKDAEAKARADAEEQRRKAQAATAAANKKKESDRRSATKYGRKELHVSQDKSGRRRKKRPTRRPVAVSRDGRHGFQAPTAPMAREVVLGETITVSELAQQMAIKANEVIKSLMKLGMMVTINQVLDQETAQLVVEEMGHSVKIRNENELEDALVVAQEESSGDGKPRAPVVTVMGHVDHGKTSLLDFIRESRVASGEAGGITQHIGAYRVNHDKGVITFLDTPGHEAFTAMRARGAQATDIVILVVAADDGVMPQTKEAIAHAKAAGVPMIVAINKMDRPNADPDRVKNELSANEVIPEDWGGDTQMVPVSALKGEGIDELLDAVLLQSEVLELKAADEGPASGVVLESSLEKGRGAVATVLVSRGRLTTGEVLLAGEEFGRVRAMFDETGQPIDSAGPSTPVVVLGLSGTPAAGDDMITVESERKAREVAEQRQTKAREKKMAEQHMSKLDNVFSQMERGERDSVNLMIKSDVQGSSEALRDALVKLSMEDVEVRVIQSAVGGITENDVNMAAASNAIIIGFNVRADNAARTAIKEAGVDLHYFSVIYEAIDQVKLAISGYLKPEIKEQIVGLAQVREVFSSPKFGDIAGCMVTEGYVQRNLPIRVLRENVVIYEGELESLRRFKDDVNEVRSGTECGIGVKNYNNVQANDQIECFERIEVPRTL